jgi:hypothetical protein
MIYNTTIGMQVRVISRYPYAGTVIHKIGIIVEVDRGAEYPIKVNFNGNIHDEPLSFSPRELVEVGSTEDQEYQDQARRQAHADKYL